MCSAKSRGSVLLAMLTPLLLPRSTLSSEAESPDYCVFQHCKANNTHVACNNYGDPDPQCPPDLRSVNMLSFKPYILGMFNNKRNEVAGGGNRFEPAARMATMQWDSDLADLALLWANKCSTQTDDCFGTARFARPGQAAMWRIFDERKRHRTVQHLLKSSVEELVAFGEKFDTADVEKYPGTSKHPFVNLFAHIIKDHNAYLGCAATISSTAAKHFFLFVCNYATAIAISSALYKAGPTASECETGRNPLYRNLCSTAEVYDFQPKKKKVRHFTVYLPQ